MKRSTRDKPGKMGERGEQGERTDYRRKNIHYEREQVKINTDKIAVIERVCVRVSDGMEEDNGQL